MGCVQLGQRRNGLDKTIKISKKSFKTRQVSKDQTETANDLLARYAELRSSKTSSLGFLRDSVRHLVARKRGKYWHSPVDKFCVEG